MVMAANMQIAPRNRTMTRSVSASNISPPLHAANLLLCQKDFALDKTRALKKKNRSCQKEHMNSSLKSENYLVIEFSIAAYKLARKWLPEQLNDSAFPHSCENVTMRKVHWLTRVIGYSTKKLTVHAAKS